MDYDAILEQVVALLQQQRRLSYRVLKLRLQLDDDTLEALKEDLIYAKHLATDEDGRVLVWTDGAAAVTPPGSGVTASIEPPDTVVSQDLQGGSPPPAPRSRVACAAGPGQAPGVRVARPPRRVPLDDRPR